MNPIRVVPVLRPDRDFDTCCTLLESVFPPDELVDRAEYAYLLEQHNSAAHPHRFSMIAAWGDDTLLGVIAGSTMTLTDDPARCFGMIEYLTVVPSDPRSKGLGSVLLDTFEYAASKAAHVKGETLAAIVGEVDEPLLPFKFAHGYTLPQGVVYAQPPIRFDAVGSPLHPCVPKLLAVKPVMLPGRDAIETDLLESLVRTMVRWRYVPVLGTDAARRRAAELIEREVVAPFIESLGGRSVIPLVRTIAAAP